MCQAATNWYSRADGAYDAAATWSHVSHAGTAAASAPCSCTPCSVNGTNYLEISHALTINCNLSYSGNPTVVVQSGGSLSVTGNASISGSVVFQIDAGATVNVTGNFSVSGGGGAVTVNGTLNISGNLSISGSYPVCGTGNINIAGSLSGSGNICGTITLPVTWLSLNAKYKKRFVDIDWETASEINNDYFTAERSDNGTSFSMVAVVNGSGNSTIIKAYSCTDEYPKNGINYYRIKQTDYDGNYDYSDIVAVYVSINDKNVSVAPKLVTDHFVNISFFGMQNDLADIFLYNLKGSVIQHSRTLVSSNSEKFYYPISPDISNSVYFISIVSGAFFDTEKIVIRSPE